MIKNCGIIITMLFFTSVVNAQDITINAADYGLREGEDAVVAIRRALKACKDQNAVKLVIPKGKYDFYPDKAAERYIRVSNNDNGMKRIVFDLHGIKNLEIDGQGSEFIMYGHMLPFDIEYSENIKLANFSIDWDKPFYFQGTVVAVDEEQNSFDLAVLDECDYEIVANELIFLEKPETAIRTWKQWAYPVEDKYGWEQNIDWNIWFDSKTKAPAYDHEKSILRSYNEKTGERYQAEEVKKGLVRFYNAAEVLPQPGWVLIVKGRKDKNRLSPAIHLFHNKNVVLQNVNVYHAGGMGLIVERSEDITLSSFNVILPPSSERLVTTTADATHFVNCKGLISYDDCHFENMLDDAANFHGIYTKIDGLVNDYTIGVKRMHGQQTGFQFAEAGDSIRLSNSTTMMPYTTLKVVEVTDYNEEYMTLRFDESIKDILEDNSVAENVSWQADVQFRNSSVRRNRARSILISTAGDVLIENNEFSSCTHISMLFEGDATFWYESGPVKNVIIRNNTFKNFGLGAGYGPLVQFSPRVTYSGAPTHYYHKNVFFLNNVCEVFGRLLVRAESVENFVFRGNTIKKSDIYPLLKRESEVFSFSYSKDIKIENNKYLLDNKAIIRIDEFSKVIVKKNKGISKTFVSVVD
ncbi:MAG: right-handed parallel beta-helix repeat-containing protein [Bacteroidota bacterium]